MKSDLSLQDKYQIARKYWTKALKDYKVFLWGYGGLSGFVWTIDEHDEASPIKKLPERPFLKELADLWFFNKLLLLFKSRQMLVTWLFCGLILWDCLKPGRRWLVAVKKFGGAEANLDRIWHIYSHLPNVFKPSARRKEGFIIIEHPEGQSVIQGAAQTSTDPRQFTFSGVWIDEMPHTDIAQEIHAAAIPAIQGGGRFLGTGTPNFKEYMFQLASERGEIDLTWPPK